MSTSEPEPPKQLREMLQEPFAIDCYFVENRKNVDSEQSLNCCDRNADKFLTRLVSCSPGVVIRGITYCQKVVKAMYKRPFSISNWARTRKKNIEDKKVEITEEISRKEVGEFDGFAAVGEQSPVLIDPESQSQFRTNTSKSFITCNSGVSETKEYHKFNLFNRQPKSEVSIRQTKQLLLDYFKEIFEVQERKKKKLQRHHCYSTSEELHQWIGDVNFATSSFDIEERQEWLDYELQKKDVGSEIADIIFEEIREGIVTEIIYSL